MKNLLAFRHALPCPQFQGKDHDRPLDERGILDCETMGRNLMTKNIRVDIILTSTAQRTRTTAHLIARQLDYPVEKIIENENWYLASAETWMAAVRQLPEETHTAMIVGHNPGIANFARSICNRDEHLSFPPLATARFQLDIAYWAEIFPGSGRLIELLTPTTL